MTRAVLIVIALAALASCDYGATEETIYRPPGVTAADRTEDGKQLYMRDCAWCHGSDGRGTERGPDVLAAPSGPALVDFVLSTGRMPIDSPDQRMIRRDPVYAPEQVDALVDFVATLGPEGPDVPVLALDDANLSHGAVLYQENCAACHSTTGIGGALTEGRVTTEEGVPPRSRIVVPPVTESTSIEIAEAIRTGPGTMPVFGDESLDDADLNALVAYTNYLKNPDDRGGASFGRIGPVAEGAVGWIAGIGILLVFIRWIGTKRGEP